MNAEIEKSEIKGYVIPYDLPSEHVQSLETHITLDDGSRQLKEGLSEKEAENYGKAKRKITSTRIRATELLQDLGLTTTQSVILVSGRTTKETIEDIHKKVKDLYANLASQLKGLNAPIEIIDRTPTIIKIPIVETQLVDFRNLAEKRLKDELERKIEILGTRLETITNLKDADRKKAKISLNEQEKEVKQTRQLAEDLGIQLTEKFDFYEKLIEKGLSILGDR